MKTTKEGRPAYHPKNLLKLFVYGYLNHIRSSRQLEKEYKRNIELMWLMKQLVPAGICFRFFSNKSISTRHYLENKPFILLPPSP
jgi:transposase